MSSADRLMAGNSRGSGAVAPAEFTTQLGFQTDIVEPVDLTSLLGRLPAPESDGAAMMRRFFLRAAAAGPFLRSLAEQWQPDVILRDTAGQDAWAVAELLDTPLATFDFAPALFGMTQQVAAGELDWFRHEMGLPPDPGFERLQSQLTIVGAPPSWFDGHHLPTSTHFVQPVEPDPLPGESFAGLFDEEDRRPLVYVTFGTAFNTPDLFQMVFDALADLDVRAVATIGLNNDAAELEVPGNVRTVPFLSQALILDHADLVVAHGGYGSLTGALRRGLPVLSLPLFPPDNRFNAAQLVKLGAGLALGDGERSPAALRRSIQRLLDHREYRDRAADIADEIAALPPIEHAAVLLEQLAAAD